MSKNLVAYFSASGVTAKIAEKIAKAAAADMFEIIPKQLYTDADLNWHDRKSRSSIEMADQSSRPAILNAVENMAQYDTVLIGFPIWWYVAPTIINTFLEADDFAGKKIVLFATSGTSGMGDTMSRLLPSAQDAEFVGERRLPSSASDKEIETWIESLLI